jgi:two-component system sensor histidine kinase HydH
MECDRYEVLSKVVRIASCTAFDIPRSLKGILRFLTKTFGLEEASFLWLDPRHKVFSKAMTASGSELFLPWRQSLGKTSEGAALDSGRPVFQPDRALFPILNGQRRFGLLTLRTPPSNPLSPSFSDLLRAVCAQLASLAQTAMTIDEHRRETAEFRFLSALGRELSHARTAAELLTAASRAILSHSGAACVILRPLYGGTVLGRDYLLTRPEYRGLRSLFLDREEKESARAVTEGRPLFRRDLSGGEELSEPFPPALVVVPLLFQDRVLGTLTLFGGGEEGGIPLTGEPEVRRFFIDAGSRIAHALERVTALEQLGNLSAENDRKLRETSLLYRISRMMHSTLRLNELMHLILSAATVTEGGGFERAMLFMINERSGVLQGMLGVTRETSSLVLPLHEDPLAWERPHVSPQVQDAQRQAVRPAGKGGLRPPTRRRTPLGGGLGGGVAVGTPRLRSADGQRAPFGGAGCGQSGN